MDKTKIEWCESTWNPVTGCLHGCEYCYARKIAHRFSTESENHTYFDGRPMSKYHELDEPAIVIKTNRKSPFSFGFEPTFHRYRLDEPQKWKKPRTIFVCSMADLFGEWVPDRWIKEVFAACEKAPLHRYLFLTKNPARYCYLHRKGLLPDKENYWFGATYDHSNWAHNYIASRPATFSLQGKMVHDAGDYYFPMYPEKRIFVSFEPLLFDMGKNIGSIGANWVIIGAETGNSKNKVVPQKEWIDNIVNYCEQKNIPVFMKDSLIPIVGEENMRREFPWEV